MWGDVQLDDRSTGRKEVAFIVQPFWPIHSGNLNKLTLWTSVGTSAKRIVLIVYKSVGVGKVEERVNVEILVLEKSVR